MKTAEVKKLVTEVLRSLPQPYSPHVIDEVFQAIESSPTWRRAYDELCRNLGRMVVNCSIGSWIGKAIGRRGEQQVPSRLNSLSDTYSILDADYIPPARPPKEPEARQIMSDFFRKDKNRWHPDLPKHRDRIIALIMSSHSVEESFAFVEEDLRRIYY
jgi:hypothetical protein